MSFLLYMRGERGEAFHPNFIEAGFSISYWRLLSKLHLHFMKETLRYLIGVAGPSGFGSCSTGEQVTRDISCSIPPNLTAIITGHSLSRSLFFSLINNAWRSGLLPRASPNS